MNVRALLSALLITTALLTGCESGSSDSNEGQSDVPSISGTIWVGTDSDGDYYEYYFLADGELHYKSPTASGDGTWTQNGSSVYMEVNDRGAERQGVISGNTMEGNAWNRFGHTWTWYAEKQ